MNQIELKWEHVRTWLLWLALPLVCGILLAFRLSGETIPEPTPTPAG